MNLSCYSEFFLLLSDFNKGATLLWILWLGNFFGDGQLSFNLAEMTLEIYICVDNMCTWFLSICNLMITMQLFFHMVKNRYMFEWISYLSVYKSAGLNKSTRPLVFKSKVVRVDFSSCSSNRASNRKFAKANNSVLYGLKLFTFEFDSNPVVIYTLCMGCWTVI